MRENFRPYTESFNLLRKKISDKYAAPFIDDTCVRPEVFPQFLPELYRIFEKYQLQATIAGHIGNGNFHIIPLMDFSDPKEKEKLYRVAKEVFDLTSKLGGSLTGEHNDGLIRTPFLKYMFTPEIMRLFKDLKHIFDPLNIFNPHKKIDLTEEFAFRRVIKQNHLQEQAA